MGVSVGDKVTYVGAVEDERGKEFTVRGFNGTFVQLEGRDDFAPMVENVRPYVEVGPGSWIAPPEFDPHIVIDPATLPVVEVDEDNPHRLLCDGSTFMVKRVDLAERVALRHVAVWHHLARVAAEDRAAELFAESVRGKRRDELAALLGRDRAITYGKVINSLRIAIDMIIDLEVGSVE